MPYGLGTSPDGDDFRDTAGDSYDAFTYDVAAAQEAWDAGLQELGVDSLTFDFVIRGFRFCSAGGTVHHGSVADKSFRTDNQPCC